KLGYHLEIRLPLAWPNDAVGVFAEKLSEIFHACGDARQHRYIQVGGDHRAHQGDIVVKAAGAGQRIYTRARQTRDQSRTSVVGLAVQVLSNPYPHAV